ncbi:MAG: CCA tRNA nucleotidyltransferase [Spirochaetaceae bacterium]
MDLFIPEEIKTISSVLNDAGYQCYLVGGAIRNQLLGKKAKDYDLATNAKPEEVMSLFKRVIPTGIKHGTVTILIGSHGFEITTYRIDGKYSDGRRPDKIEFTPSIEEDLLRRDFTINSIAFNIHNDIMLDINRGIEDLNDNVIRAIGIPSKRFDEDALRLVRACRFASQLNFSIDKLTYIAMSKTLGKLKDVSKERISDELVKILSSNHPSIGFRHFYNCGMLEILFPNIYNSCKNDIISFNKALMDMDTIISDKPFIRFSRLLSITPNEKRLDTLKIQKLSNQFINSTLHLLKFIDTDITKIETRYQVRKFIAAVNIIDLQDLKVLWQGMQNIDKVILSSLFEKIELEITQNCAFVIKDLKITGKDLITETELFPGPQLGKVLEGLLEMVLKNPELNTHEQLITLSKDI